MIVHYRRASIRHKSRPPTQPDHTLNLLVTRTPAPRSPCIDPVQSIQITVTIFAIEKQISNRESCQLLLLLLLLLIILIIILLLILLIILIILIIINNNNNNNNIIIIAVIIIKVVNY